MKLRYLIFLESKMNGRLRFLLRFFESDFC